MVIFISHAHKTSMYKRLNNTKTYFAQTGCLVKDCKRNSLKTV